ncbi:MAG: UDP-N-acetylmuramoyl-tripeptide--D-alanyl-D-alanine ligase, partial [Nitrospiraceae bacterium]|nr:UDP-N-acetylmuramoyl-tripeptide--D-alanyl-D-alanine ligase [Nitrospiraceae bacterium]
VDDPLVALQQFAAHHRSRYDIPVFALTGSCGKTTAKDMTSALLSTLYAVTKTQGNLNNEIGCPVSLLQIDGDTGMAIIEMGANHTGEIARLCELAKPTESAITIVAPAHLEGFGSVENVARAKGEIADHTDPDGSFYVNEDDEWCRRIGETFPGRKIRFGASGSGSDLDVALAEFESTGPGQARLRVDPVGDLNLSIACRAHATNVLLAIAVALRHGVTEFQEPLAEACERTARFHVDAIGPFTVIDDTYNANPASMAAGLEALASWPTKGLRVAAVGEMLELGGAAGEFHRAVGEKAAECGVDHLFARGPHACDTIEAARDAGVPHAEAIDSHRDIAQAIHRNAQNGGLLFVKGSRGMRMERVIEALRELYP